MTGFGLVYRSPANMFTMELRLRTDVDYELTKGGLHHHDGALSSN